MIVRFLAKTLWDISEFTGISLGRFAPKVFELMIGCKGEKQ